MDNKNLYFNSSLHDVLFNAKTFLLYQVNTQGQQYERSNLIVSAISYEIA